MTNHDLPPVSKELGQLFEAERARPAPPPEVAGRVMSRLVDTLAIPPPSAPQMPPAGPAGASGGSFLKVVSSYVAVFVAGASLGGLAYATWGPPKIERVVVKVPVETQPPPPAPVVEPKKAVEPTPEEPKKSVAPSLAVPKEPARIKRRPKPQAKLPAVQEPSGAAERRLIERARTALVRSQPQDALTALQEHERRFGTGTLVEEREALRVQALARAARTEEAKAAARAFETKFPRSLFLPAVRAASGN